MSKAFLLDIFCTGQDCYDSLNNPFQVNFQVLDTGNIALDKQIDINPIEDVTWATKVTLNVVPNRTSGVPLLDALEDIYPEMEKARNENMYLLGYNQISYDLKILNDHFEKILNKPRIEWATDMVIDVMTLSQMTFPYREIGNYTVESCLAYIDMNFKRISEWHDNRSCRMDNSMTMKIYDYCCEKHKLDKNDYISVAQYLNSPREITEMSFGKYKGITIKELLVKDHGYASWLMRNDDIRRKNPNLVASIRKCLSEMP